MTRFALGSKYQKSKSNFIEKFLKQFLDYFRQLIKQLQEQPSMYDTEAVETNLVGDEKSSIDTDTEIALFGTLTPLFIDMSNMNLDQKEANSFYQYQMQNSFCLVSIKIIILWHRIYSNKNLIY